MPHGVLERVTARFRRTTLGAALAAALAGATGCGAPDVHVDPKDPEYEFRVGMAEIEHRRSVQAQEHLKRFLDAHPGHVKADSAQYFLGLAKMRAKLFPEAAVEFQILNQEYPRSPLRPAAAFQECASYQAQVRSPQLDPTFALRARTCFNDYLTRYPGAADSAAAVHELSVIADYLAEKELRLGEMFVRMKRPEAARVYLEGLLEDYPGSRWEADACYQLGRAREQMFDIVEAIAAYRRAVEAAPESGAARSARDRLSALGETLSAPTDSAGSGPGAP